MLSRLDGILGIARDEVVFRDTSNWEEKEELLLGACHPKQLGFVMDPGRRLAAVVPRGGGKTTAGRARILRRMMRVPEARCLFVAPTQSHAEELMWAPLKDTLERLEIAASYNETKLRCTLRKNGAQLQLASLDNKRSIERQRGKSFHEVGIDECASCDQRLLENFVLRVIGPRLGDYQGVLWETGTPGETLFGHFYEITRPGSDIARDWSDRDKEEFKGWKRWGVHRWNLLDGAKYVPAIKRLWEEALIEKEANGWSDDHPIWRREFLGEWAADDSERIYKYRPHAEDGSSWNQWDPPKNKLGVARLPDGHDWRFVYGLDLGHADPFALEVFAYSLTDKTLYHVYEFVNRGMYARTIAEVLIGKGLDANNPGGIIGETGWPDGTAADFAGVGDALLEELKNVYGIPIAKADKKNKHAAIELFNGDLIDGRIKVLKGSKLEEQLGHLQWVFSDSGLKEDKRERNDATDAAVYARSCAFHQFADDARPPGPQRGSPEAADLWAKESEEKAARDADNEFTDYLGDDDNFDFFG